MKTIATLFILVLTKPLAAHTNGSPQRRQESRSQYFWISELRASEYVSAATIPTVTQRSVLSKVFRNYLTMKLSATDLDTGNNSEPLSAARNSG